MVLTIPDITLNANGAAALVSWLSQQSTAVQSPLVADITNAATTCTVAVANWQPAVNALVGIEDEICRVTAKSGPTLTITRGSAGTSAVAHLAGAMVRELKYQTKEEAAKALVVGFLKQLVRADAGINAPVVSAQATRDAAVDAAVV